MGIFSKAFAPSRVSAAASEWKTTEQTLELFKQIFGTNTTTSGENITERSALEVPTVLACTRVYANGISQIPLKLLRESSDGRTRSPAKDHALYWPLFRKPNQWQTSFQYRQTIGVHLTLWGNHYSFKNRPYQGSDAVELIPLDPDAMTVRRTSQFKDPRYFYRDLAGSEQEIPADNIWHISGLGWNGWSGLQPVRLAREAIGLAMAAQRQQARLFKNGVQASGAYSIEGTLKKGQYDDLRDFIVENTTGDNAGMPLILDRGAKWLQTSMSSADAQTNETRRAQIEEICRALGVFPQMVGYSDKTATFASAEQFFIAHVVHTLAPLYELIEQSIAVNLLTDKEMRGGIYAKFIEEGLLRGSMVETANMLDKLVNGGIMFPNEARDKLDLNPDPDPASDKLRVPANIVGKNPPSSGQPPTGTPGA